MAGAAVGVGGAAAAPFVLPVGGVAVLRGIGAAGLTIARKAAVVRIAAAAGSVLLGGCNRKKDEDD